MRHVIIASHHRFADGLRDTLEFIGGVSGIETVCAYVDETPLDDVVSGLFAGIPEEDEVLVLSDIVQGSVNQAFSPYISDRVFLVAGVNVACCLELVLETRPLTPELVRGAVEQASRQMVFMNECQVEDCEDDE